jgi:hypothetical protein
MIFFSIYTAGAVFLNDFFGSDRIRQNLLIGSSSYKYLLEGTIFEPAEISPDNSS